MWAIGYGHHKLYEPTREALMAAFAKSWRRGEGSRLLALFRKWTNFLRRDPVGRKTDLAMEAWYHPSIVRTTPYGGSHGKPH